MTAERFLPGNRIRLLENGTDYFPALLQAIGGARDEIHLATYIFTADATGTAVGSALQAAARRGVAVHLLLDGFGSRDFPPTLAAEFAAAGIMVLYYNPHISPWGLRRDRLRRLHRKVAVIDGEIAFVGGINIGDDRQAGDPEATASSYDYALELRGVLLGEIHREVKHLWNWQARLHFRLPWRTTFLPAGYPPAGRQNAAFVTRDSLRHRRQIERSYLRAIHQAKEEIVIANAYFLPGLRFRHALIKAAGRGVKITLLLQGRGDHRLLQNASRALYDDFLRAGITIHEYQRGLMHAKVAVIDGHWATVGSSNIDPFSLWLANEANVMVLDRGFAAELRARLATAIAADALQLHLDDWRRQPLLKRALTWFSYGLVRILVGMAGYGREPELG